MRSSTVLTQLALGRAAVGLVLLVRPRTLPDLLAADPAEGRQVSWVVQMLGAREVALGLGGAAVLGAGGRPDARAWLAAGLLCDAVDALAVAAAVGSGRVRAGTGGAVVAVAAAAVAVQAGALARR